MSLVPFVHLDDALGEARSGDVVELSDVDAHHLHTVLRLRGDAPVRVADGCGGWADAVLEDGAVRLTTDARHEARSRPLLGIAQGLPKGRKIDEVIRAVTELGVDAITLVAAARSVARVDPARTSRSVERWEAIARSASEQSRQPHRPVIDGPIRTADLAAGRGVVLVAHPGGAPLPEAIASVRTTERITVAIGPEGGWTDDEVAAFSRGGAVTVGFGPRVLRTEHAAAAAVAVLSASLGRWDGPVAGPAPP